MKHFILLFLFCGFFGLEAICQTWSYNFGTSTGSYSANASSPTFLAQPASGGGEDFVRIGNGGGSVNLETSGQGIQKIGSGARFRIVSPTNTSVNKFSIYNYTPGKSFYIKYNILFGGNTGNNVSSGVFSFFVGDGNTFNDANSFSGTQTFTGLQFTFGSSGSITTKYRNGSTWTNLVSSGSPEPIVQGNNYTLEIFGNNSTSSVNYMYNGVNKTVNSNKFDLYINGVQVGINLAKANIANNANIDSFMLYGESSAGNVANAFIDDIMYSNSINSSYETYLNFFSKTLGSLNSLSTYTTNVDGTGMINPSNFTQNYTTYNVRNNNTPSVDGDWIVSGTNSNVIVGDGTNSCTASFNSSISLPKLAVSANAQVLLSSQSRLTVNETLSNDAGISGLVLESGASLMQSSSNVNATVKRQIDPRGSVGSKDGWHFLSSPVAAQPFQSVFVSSPPSSTEDFYFWDETSDTWINSKVGDFAPYTFNAGAFGNNFILGKGYIVAYQDNSTKEFTGFLNSSDVMIPLSYTASEDYKGYNLIGNPFPCSMIWNATSWGGNGFVEGVAKVILSAGGSYNDINQGDIIAPMNGFFVRTNSALTLTAHKSDMTHGGTWYKSSEEMKSFSLVAKDLQDNTYQYTNFRINPQATAGYDLAYDGQFMALYAPKFYSINGDKFLSTNAIPSIQDNDEFQLGFIKNDGDSYEITAEGTENIGATVYLTDLKTGQTQNLSLNPSYRFMSVNGDDPNRFKISFNGVGIHNPSEVSPVKIFSVDGEIQIECSTRAKIEVFTIAGQIIHSSSNSDQNVYRIVLNQPSGYYIVRVTSNNSTKVAKVYIY